MTSGRRAKANRRQARLVGHPAHMRMVPHEETQRGWDGQHYEDVATLVGWCADEEHLTEARGATHDALIDLMGDRRRGAVGWKWKTGQEARDLLNEFTTNETSQPLLDHYRHLRGMLREYGGWIVVAYAPGVPT